MLSLKKSWKKLLVALGCMLIVGVADARIPRPYWENIEYYNASGAFIGWTFTPCVGPIRTYGTTSGAVSTIRESGPCT